MRRNIAWLLSTVTAFVLLFSYHTSTSSTLADKSSQVVITSTALPSTSSSGAGSSGASSTSGGSSGSSSGGTSSSSSDATVTGPTVQTQWGPVQVQITTSGGEITQVSVLQYPSGNGRDEQINSYALPILVDETVSAQSANIDMVSGATVTSVGYLQSLQAAIDQAGL